MKRLAPLPITASDSPGQDRTPAKCPAMRRASRSLALVLSIASAVLVLVALVDGFAAIARSQPSLDPVPQLARLPALAGSLERLWDSTGGPQPLHAPYGITIAKDGALWIADSSYDRIQILGPDGTFLENWGSHGSGNGEFEFYSRRSLRPYPYGDVAFDAAGNIYVADTGNYRVQKFAPDRTFVLSWGSEGTGNGQFLAPVSVAVGPDGAVYVSDQARHDVQAFTSDGMWLGTIGGLGSAEGQFDGPEGIAVDANGHLWVADFGNSRIQRFSPTGSFVETIGRAGFQDGELSNPSDVMIDGLGRIFVADTHNHRLQIFADDGWPLVTGPADVPYVVSVAVAADGTIFATDEVGAHAFRLFLPEGEGLMSR